MLEVSQIVDDSIFAPWEIRCHLEANIESSQVWGTSCLVEIIYDLISRQCSMFMQEVSQIGDDSIFAPWEIRSRERGKTLVRNQTKRLELG